MTHDELLTRWERYASMLQREIMDSFESGLWGKEFPRQLTQRQVDASRHFDPRAEGSTDPLGRFCTIHSKPYESDGGGPGAFSICPDCYTEERTR